MEPSTQKIARIEVVDALRGFAILAILLIHSLMHFFYPVYPTDSPQWLSALDQVTFKAVFTLFSGKAYAIFSILFGFTFYIQNSNQRKKGNDFGYRFLWRMVLLAVFAQFNAAFFPSGDVLMLFVYASPILFITRNWSDKAVFILMIALLFQPIEWIHFFLSRTNPSYQLPDYGVTEMSRQIFENTQKGNFIDFVRTNLTLGQKASFYWILGTGRLLQGPGLFLLGFYLGRKQFFVTSDRNIKRWKRVLIISVISFVLINIFKKLFAQGDEITRSTAGAVFDMWQNLAFTLVLITLFVLLYQNIYIRKRISFLTYYGKMSLTNYISQSIFGAFIYFPIGLNLAPYTGYTLSFLIGIAIFITQLIISKYWLRKFRQGPLEKIWHKWTWIPFRKPKNED